MGFDKINKGPLYKMHVLVLVALGSLLATTAHAGAGALDYSTGTVGCRGKLIVEPKFRRGDIVKSSEEGFVEVFKIWANKKKDKVRTNKITILGTCCWVIEHRHGATQELRPGQSITPSIAYIRKLKTMKCSKSL